MKRIIFIFFLIAAPAAFAQVKIGDNPTTISPGAALEIESTNKGFLPPRMTTAQRDVISNPVNGLTIFNATTNCLNIYNASDSQWMALCGETSSGSAEFSPLCETLSAQGSYYTGTELTDQNTLTLDVSVQTPGTYAIVTSVNGMLFSATGTFSMANATETVILKGAGYPLAEGSNIIPIQIGTYICTTIIYVDKGTANITSCATLGTITGTLSTGTPLSGVSVNLTNIIYTGGSRFGITSNTTNGIKLGSPLNGTLEESPATLSLSLTGTPLVSGNNTLTYGINNQTSCTITIPVTSGTGRSDGINCTGTLAGTYNIGTAMTASNTKEITINVITGGTFNIVTNTVNGVSFSYSGTLLTGSQNVTLTATGTPSAKGSFTYDLSVSSSGTTFDTCTFNVSYTLPASVPDFSSITCGSFGTAFSYLKASNPGNGDNLGENWRSLAMSSDGLTLVASTWKEDGSNGGINPANNNSSTDSGIAYVYSRTSTSAPWTLQSTLKASNVSPGDHFGYSVDISSDGNTLAVSARYEDGSGTGVNPASNDSTTDAGAVYVFTRSGSTWSQQAYIKSMVPGIDYRFGWSVGLSGDGNTLAVGELQDDGSGIGVNPQHDTLADNAGAVYVYKRTGGTWAFDAYLKSSNMQENDLLGYDVRLNYDGTTLVTSAINEDGGTSGINPADNNTINNAGAVYVFVKNGTVWSQQATIKSPNPDITDYYGQPVDISNDGNTLIIGAYLEDGNGKGVNPAMNNSLSNSGALYVYSRSGTTWTYDAYIKSANPGASDRFGFSGAISGDGLSIIVGSQQENSTNDCVNSTYAAGGIRRGALYQYSKINGKWYLSNIFKPSEQDDYDTFGSSLAINNDGSVVAGGAAYEDGSNSGVNPVKNNSGNATGCIYVYTK